MAVQVWIGDKPEHPNERRAIVALANGLERLESLYLLLANFNVGGRTIDLAVIKQDAIFIIELKHCDGKLFGGVNGPWYLEDANGQRKRLNPGRKNPYNQVISYYYSLTNFLNEQRGEFLTEQKASQVNFRSCRRAVVIAPRIMEGSDLQLDWKVELKGLDELPAFLLTERSAEISLSEEEMLAIPQLLSCTRWKDINELIAGVLPSWSAEERPAAPVVAEPAPAPEPEPAPAGFWMHFQGALRTTTGRIALVMSVIILGLLSFFALRPTREATIPQPPSNVALTTPIGQPAGGEFANAPLEETASCTWTSFQSVGKHWDEEAQRWISVGVEATAVEFAPQVIVTLEQVDYCGEEIVLDWSVQNNSDQAIIFPLHKDNITILDPVGNEYIIDDAASEPAIVRVQPDSQERGVARVDRPVSQNAPSLLVRLKEQPFGEASWLVALEGN